MIGTGVRAGFVVATGAGESVFAETFSLVAVSSILASAIIGARLFTAVFSAVTFFAKALVGVNIA